MLKNFQFWTKLHWNNYRAIKSYLRWFFSKEPNIDCTDKTWYTDVTSPKDDKKVIKSGGHRARFDVTMLTNTAILDPLTKPRAAQN